MKNDVPPERILSPAFLHKARLTAAECIQFQQFTAAMPRLHTHRTFLQFLDCRGDTVLLFHRNIVLD